MPCGNTASSAIDSCMTVPNPCPLCGNSDVQPVLRKNNYQLARCAACGLLHVNPPPTAAELEAHYQNPAYFEGESDQGYRDYADMRKALQPHFARRLKAIARLGGTSGRLLDFGCAAGYFLETARAGGWEIAGVELARDMAARAAQMLGISIPEHLEALEGKPFDVITLWEVIEHVPDPVALLAALRARLRPGGLLMLSTPNNGHWQALREPERWEAYRPPSHLIYFDRRTLADALRRAGFEQITITGTMPLPALPSPVRRLTEPLRLRLAHGNAPAWGLSLLAWRVIRLLGLAWHRARRSTDDVRMTLEASAFCP